MLAPTGARLGATHIDGVVGETFGPFRDGSRACVLDPVEIERCVWTASSQACW